MKLAVSATGPDLEAEIDPRFGRCQYLLIVDPETMAFEAVANPGPMAAGGAGIQTAQLVASKGAEVVLTGHCGPNAYQALSAGGIKVFTGLSGKIKEAVGKYKSGELTTTSGPTAPPHSGMGGFSPPGPQAASAEQDIDVLKSQTEALRRELDQIKRRIEELKRRG